MHMQVKLVSTQLQTAAKPATSGSAPGNAAPAVQPQPKPATAPAAAAAARGTAAAQEKQQPTLHIPEAAVDEAQFVLDVLRMLGDSAVGGVSTAEVANALLPVSGGGVVHSADALRQANAALRRYPHLFAVKETEFTVSMGIALITAAAAPGAPPPPAAWPRLPHGVPPPRPGWAPSAARTAGQRAYAESLAARTPYVVAIGPAGTGKTHLAVHAGAAALLSGAAARLIITRPAVAVDEDLGYLPGNIDAKMAPFLVPILDVLADVWSADALQQLQAERRLQVVPLGFMRGRTFDDAFIVADEMQNCSDAQMRTLLTRLGLRSRLVLTGDPQQCDRAQQYDNGLRSLVASLRATLRGNDEEAEEEKEAAAAVEDAAEDDAADADAAEAQGSLRAAVVRDFALHELDASSVQRHAAVRTALRLLGGESA
jgi:phosphate starvation-inducible PhoH-like protein